MGGAKRVHTSHRSFNIHIKLHLPDIFRHAGMYQLQNSHGRGTGHDYRQRNQLVPLAQHRNLQEAAKRGEGYHAGVFRTVSATGCS